MVWASRCAQWIHRCQPVRRLPGTLTEGRCLQEAFRITPREAWPSAMARRAFSATPGPQDIGPRSGQPGPPPVHPFFMEALRGMGQVVFCNSAVSGGFLAGALLIGDAELGVLALAGVTSATLTARAASLDPQAISDGLMGYNGALVGCALSVFQPGVPLWTALAATIGCTPQLATSLAMAALTAAGAAATVLLAAKLGPMLAPVPQYTIAFNAVVLAILAGFSLALPPPQKQKPSDSEQSQQGGSVLGFLYRSGVIPDMLEASLHGVSQIFVVNHAGTGLMLLAGIFCYSPAAAAVTFAGSFLGSLTAVLLGQDVDEVMDGLWGYNSALTALAVSIFFVPLGVPFGMLACGGAMASTLATIGFKEALGSAKLPPMTVPFCTVASGCFLLGGRVPVSALSSRKSSEMLLALLKQFEALAEAKGFEEVCNLGTGASVRVEGEADDSAVGKLRRFIRARLLNEVVESPAKGSIALSFSEKLHTCGLGSCSCVFCSWAMARAALAGLATGVLADQLRRHWVSGTARYTRCEASDKRFELVSKEKYLESKKAASTTYFQVPGGMRCCDLKIGSGEEVAEKGWLVCIHFEGKWLNGKVIESSYNAGPSPLCVEAGNSPEFPALGEGVLGMRSGGRRELIIPPSMNRAGVEEVMIYVVEVASVAQPASEGTVHQHERPPQHANEDMFSSLWQRHTPIITTADCEGAGEMFRISAEKAGEEAVESKAATDGAEFFGRAAYLTVSGQLAVENFCCGIEPELAFANLEDDMDCAESFIRFCVSNVLESCKSDVDFFNLRVDKEIQERLELIASKPFARMSYTEAVEAVLQKHIKAGDVKFEFEVEWGKELQTEHELQAYQKFLTDEVCKGPCIVYNYPKDCKAFYMRLNEDGKTVAAMDLLCPGIGELVGGSQREERIEAMSQVPCAHLGQQHEQVLDDRIAEWKPKSGQEAWGPAPRLRIPHAIMGVLRK
ncbi:Asparagine--tRNA ligase [Symbiodinium microadriaticum]|uniref:peptidylprolyl isomerase n=1 Tax=Symbiodinium microadriaticum TaxID=2951 RepID=A0A1Q9DEE6_SYMMI|nr:Asparagine--tRNA ligase [Symbiodinium microadriaticum]